MFGALKKLCWAGVLGIFSTGVAGQATVGFATLPPGSLLHAQASIIAKVIQDHSKLQVRVLGFGGDAPMFDAVNSEKADFLILDVGEMGDAHHGRRNWEGKPKPNLRLALTLYGFGMGPFVRKDSNIHTVADLKGKRVPSGWVQQTGNLMHSQAVLATGGLTYNDVVQVPAVNVVRGADDFKSGKLDVFFFAVGAPKVAEVAASVGGLRYLPLDTSPGAEAKMQKIRTDYYFSTINPAPHIAGIEKPTQVQTIDFVIGVGAHVKDEVVIEFVKAMRANKKALVEAHPTFHQFNPEGAAKVQPSLPFHPGILKYYKEIGIWRG